MPDTTDKPLACGHDRSEQVKDCEGTQYCQRCEDVSLVNSWLAMDADDQDVMHWAYIAAARRELARVRAERDKAQTDLNAAQDLVFELFRDGCYLLDTAPPRYNHGCTSVYEEAQKYLINIRRVKAEECVRP